ncbi:hypothetical protein LPJ66_003725 [Kickxella alabastrina]|uniref:Uncharacterized protein n=1 Tax=Kickxella alabastrina TaxID=61397 RepID=A0ACC1IJA7_9FUNG|nr:hypothetical protein LPJ66_003725 [Kickxella alabastrina]
MIGPSNNIPQHQQTQTQTQYLVGSAGGEEIKRMMSLGKPKQAIAEFGSENGLDIPAAGAIYRLLDSLGYTRWSIHKAALESALLAAQSQIQGANLPLDKHMDLLNQIKPYLGFKRLQHLPLLLLAKQPTMIPADIRNMITSNADLYSGCSVGVKQELWRHDNALFRQHMLPLIRTYAICADLAEMLREMTGPHVKTYTRKRREHPVFKEIAHAVAGDLQLYMLCLGLVREELLHTNDPALGTLRHDLVMAMHENNASEIVRDDVCHNLAWTLDACILKQELDAERVVELQRCFDAIDKDSAPYGEIALIFSNPYTRHVLAQYILALLEKIAPNLEVSALYSELIWPTLVMTIGLNAPALISSAQAQFPKIDRNMKRVFFNRMILFVKMSQTRDRVFRARNQRGGTNRHALLDQLGGFSPTSDTDPTESIEAIETRPTDNDLEILASNEPARQVLYVYLLKRVAALDLGMLNQWLPVIVNALPIFLGLSQQDMNHSSEPSLHSANTPMPPAVELERRMFAFEIDAFAQSLVSRARDTKGVVAAILNSVAQETGRGVTGADSSIGMFATPFVRFLDQTARVRHVCHEQAIVFLTHCANILSAEYNGGAKDASMSNDMSSFGPGPALGNKENAVCFIFEFAERAAAHFAVDPLYSGSLKEHYRRLAAACPEQAFKYRICHANSPNVSKFLSS